MRNCPVCSKELEAVECEGFRVMQCPGCKGRLLETGRLEGIQRSGRTPAEKLKSEASADFKGSTTRALRCPKCHVPMDKVAIDVPVLKLEMDVCGQCSLVWLDGGELALAQLANRARSKFVNTEEMKRRLRELEASPERKAQFEENLARLPSESPASDELFQTAEEQVLEELLRGLLRG